ncbi:serine hydrolase domain-containing protein, partial [Arthrospira platensis SPKY1]|nr:serine hydrolase domain-containing protein [Arthrospira platensis SPKY1]
MGQTTLSAKQIELLDSIATQDVPKNAPGIATAIIQDGKVIYEKYAGFADLTDSTLIKNSTRFNIASNGKQFTALAILTLVDKKKLKLSDDIRKWFPNIYPNVK